MIMRIGNKEQEKLCVDCWKETNTETQGEMSFDINHRVSTADRIFKKIWGELANFDFAVLCRTHRSRRSRLLEEDNYTKQNWFMACEARKFLDRRKEDVKIQPANDLTLFQQRARKLYSEE